VLLLIYEFLTVNAPALCYGPPCPLTILNSVSSCWVFLAVLPVLNCPPDNLFITRLLPLTFFSCELLWTLPSPLLVCGPSYCIRTEDGRLSCCPRYCCCWAA